MQKQAGDTMNTMQFVVPCHFGTEAVLKREIIDLGYEICSVEDGRVIFDGDAEALCRANLFLRTAKRVLLLLGRFHAESFEELFQGTRAIAWEDILPANAKFWVTKASPVKSRLFSAPDIQSVMKKAMVERMREHYGYQQFPEDGDAYPVRVFLYKDEVTVALDTSGEPLHKRGYRQWTPKAPLDETLAAALIDLTPWKADRILVDPFCGSGTILIEAAMKAANIAPGVSRNFLAEHWDHLVPRSEWAACREEALEMENRKIELSVQGFDIDGKVLKLARENARLAGVDHLIHLQQRPVSELQHSKKYGFLITNPPYGERLEDKQALPKLYQELGESYRRLDNWSMYVITSYEHAERDIGRKADRNRKLYNGMIKTYYYQFLGARPPRRENRQGRAS